MSTSMPALDGPQVLRKSYDETNEALKTTLVDDSANALTVVDQLDTLLTPGTSLNGVAGPLVTVVASLAADVRKVHMIDLTGKSIGLYVNDVLRLMIHPGADTIIECQFSQGEEIKAKCVEATPPTAGTFSLQFIG